MHRIISWIGFGLLVVASCPPVARAAVKGRMLRSLPLGAAPLDVAATADGRWTFVLMPGGEVRVYSASGKSEGSLQVEQGAERIAPSPAGDRLFVSGSSLRQVDIVAVDFVYSIDVTGSPFEGPADAPVVVAVYSDFQ